MDYNDHEGQGLDLCVLTNKEISHKTQQFQV